MSFVFFAFAAGSDLAFAALCVPFIKALKADAPDIYKAVGQPSVAKYLWLHRFPKEFSKLISSGAYRIALANYQQAKAWASWVFVSYWLRIAAMAVFIVSLFR